MSHLCAQSTDQHLLHARCSWLLDHKIKGALVDDTVYHRNLLQHQLQWVCVAANASTLANGSPKTCNFATHSSTVKPAGSQQKSAGRQAGRSRHPVQTAVQTSHSLLCILHVFRLMLPSIGEGLWLQIPSLLRLAMAPKVIKSQKIVHAQLRAPCVSGYPDHATLQIGTC